MFPGVIKNLIINRVWLTEGRMLLAGKNWSQGSASEVSTYLRSQVQVRVQEFAFSNGNEGKGRRWEKGRWCVWCKIHWLKALSRKFELKHFKGLDRCGCCSLAWWDNSLSQRNLVLCPSPKKFWLLKRAALEGCLRNSLECTWGLHSSGDRGAISKAGGRGFMCLWKELPQPGSTSNRNTGAFQGNSNNPSWKALWKRKKFPVSHLFWEKEMTGCEWETKMGNGFWGLQSRGQILGN